MPGGRTAGAALLARCSFPPPGTTGRLRVLGRRRLHRPPACSPSPPAARHGRARRPRPAPRVSGRSRRRRSPWPHGSACRATSIVADIERGPNLEARARTARQAALPAGALTGHTADDRAETMLINLLRGAGLDGLTAMGPAPTRPLLALRRWETRGPVRGGRPGAGRRSLQRRPPLRPQPCPGRAAAPDGRHRRARRRRAARAHGQRARRRCRAGRRRHGHHRPDRRPSPRRRPARPRPPRDPALAGDILRQRLPARPGSRRAGPPGRLGEHRACEIAGGVRVERHRQRLRIVGDGAVQSTSGMGDAGGTR